MTVFFQKPAVFRVKIYDFTPEQDDRIWQSGGGRSQAQTGSSKWRGSERLTDEGVTPPGACRLFTSVHDGDWRLLSRWGEGERESPGDHGGRRGVQREGGDGARIIEIGFCKNGKGPGGTRTEKEAGIFRIFRYEPSRTSRAPSSYAFLQSSGNCFLCRFFFASGSKRVATYFE